MKKINLLPVESVMVFEKDNTTDGDVLVVDPKTKQYKIVNNTKLVTKK